jgi:hypothetical protein
MYEHCEVEVIENVLPEDNFKSLEEFLLSPKFPWHWEPTTLGSSTQQFDTPQMVTPIYICQNQHVDASGKDVRIPSQVLEYPEFEMITTHALDKAKQEFGYELLWRIKCNLLMPYPNSPMHHPRHADTNNSDGNYVTINYYVNDSDGDTFLFPRGQAPIQITPKANSAVIFDAKMMHCSSNPINSDRRVVINAVVKIS